MAKKKLTIEHLAIMTQRGFSGVDKKLEEVDNKVEGLKTEMKKEFEKVVERFDRIENASYRRTKIVWTKLKTT